VIIRDVRKSEKRSQAFIKQLGSRELVTVIECVTGDGLALDPFIIFKGAVH
jgi:hypothetical protein